MYKFFDLDIKGIWSPKLQLWQPAGTSKAKALDSNNNVKSKKLEYQV